MLQSKGSDMTEQLNNVFIGFLLKIISETLFFFFKLLCCKCNRNDKIAIYLTFKISPIKTKLTSFKVLPNSFSLNDYTLLISASGLFFFSQKDKKFIRGYSSHT